MNKSLVLITQPAAKSHAALEKLIVVAQKVYTPLGHCMKEVFFLGQITNEKMNITPNMRICD